MSTNTLLEPETAPPQVGEQPDQFIKDAVTRALAHGMDPKVASIILLEPGT